MDDATLVRNTKLRLARSKSLKDWTMEAVLTNLDAYTQEEGANYLKTKLSPQLRDQVLQELLRTRRPGPTTTIEEFNRMKRSVFVLMNTRTKKLDLDVLMSFYPSDLNTELDFIEVLRMVSIAAPNVRHLKIKAHHIRICSDHIGNRNTSSGFLSSLKELRILEFVGSVNNPMDLLRCCRNLPNLQVLSAPGADLEHTNISEEEIRLSFGNLRLLHSRILLDTLKKIWKVLPNQDILRERILPNGLTLEDFLEDEYVPRVRKYLSYDSLIFGSNVCADLSNIKYLEFHCSERRWNDLERNLKLPTPIDGLNLFMLNSQEIVEAVLLKYGANLRWLSLRGNGYQNVELNRISELCPKLAVLSMASVRVTGNVTKPANFSHLEELVTDRVEMMNGSLIALLSSSPNLRKLKLEANTCSLDDVQQVKNLVIEKKILGSLQALHWSITSATPVLVFNEIAAIVKNASATLPDLRKMKIIFDSIRLNINNYRYFLFIRQNYIGFHEPIKADTSLIKILNLYE